MIQENELRIGNNVEHKGDVLRIRGIPGDTFNVYASNEYLEDVYRYHVCDINPLTLTKDILVQLGFKPLCKDFQKHGIILHSRKRGFIISKSVLQMKYVHQLQNYVFAKTGKEINLI